jgi:hypothetical protein
MVTIKLENLNDDGLDVCVSSLVDNDGPFTLIECDPLSTDRIILSVKNVGIPGVIGPGIEFDVSELVRNAINEQSNSDYFRT